MALLYFNVNRIVILIYYTDTAQYASRDDRDSTASWASLSGVRAAFNDITLSFERHVAILL